MPPHICGGRKATLCNQFSPCRNHYMNSGGGTPMVRLALQVTLPAEPPNRPLASSFCEAETDYVNFTDVGTGGIGCLIGCLVCTLKNVSCNSRRWCPVQLVPSLLNAHCTLSSRCPSPPEDPPSPPILLTTEQQT